mmetsp:Transcript_25850/g.60622  ORF Transcript_25850/g.60622 Transcript_25850/m.60622 type:complete len:253 (-) Transcript_25850:315-1073(-)
MKRFVVAFHHLAIPSTPRSFLDRASPANRDLATRLGLQFFLRLTARSDDQSNEVVLGMLFDWDPDFLRSFALKQSRLTGGWIHAHEFLENVVTFCGVSLSPTNGPRIFAFAVRTVDWWGRRRSFSMSPWKSVNPSRFGFETVQFDVDFSQFGLQVSHFCLLFKSQIGGHSRQSQAKKSRWGTSATGRTVMAWSRSSRRARWLARQIPLSPPRTAFTRSFAVVIIAVAVRRTPTRTPLARKWLFRGLLFACRG